MHITPNDYSIKISMVACPKQPQLSAHKSKFIALLKNVALHYQSEDIHSCILVAKGDTVVHLAGAVSSKRMTGQLRVWGRARYYICDLLPGFQVLINIG